MDDVDSTNFIEKKTNRYTQEETNTLLKTPPPLGALRVTRGPKAQGGGSTRYAAQGYGVEEILASNLLPGRRERNQSLSNKIEIKIETERYDTKKGKRKKKI